MNPVLAQVYGLDKTASEEEGQATLDTISAADLLAAHQAGEVDINDFLVSEEDPEKTAGLDLSQFSEEDLQQALGELSETQKLASSEEQYWDAAGRQMARGYADEQTKQASTELPMDLNELSAEEIIGLAYELADEMDKTADERDYEEDDIDLNAMTPEEIIELAYHLEGEMDNEKTAGAFDLNEFSVDEFIGFAADLEGGMEKEAMSRAQVMAAMRRGGSAVSGRAKKGGRAIDDLMRRLGKASAKQGRRVPGGKRVLKGDLRRKKVQRLYGYGTAGVGAAGVGGATLAARRR